MKAEIIAIGTEILLGQIANTNAQFLAQELSELNINHYVQTVVGDNPSRIKATLDLAKDRSNLIILTGGLGPTEDDLTKETLAEFLDEELALDQASLDAIRQDFQSSGRKMKDNNNKMALSFQKGQLFPNEYGQAVGTSIEKEGRNYIVLPGPPRELKPMFRKYVKPYLAKMTQEDLVLTSSFLNYYGIGESDLSAQLDDLIADQSNPSLAIYSNGQTVTVRVSQLGESTQANQRVLAEWRARINDRIGSYFFGEGLDLMPSEVLLEALVDRKQTVAIAESLTGGLAASTLVNQSGASSVFRGGLVAYDKEAKVDVLGVSRDTIDRDGMVSAACATEMAQQARKRFKSDYGLSFTGVAGPAPMEGHEVGTVFVGLAGPDSNQVFKLKCWGGRAHIRQQAVNTAFLKLTKMLKET